MVHDPFRPEKSNIDPTQLLARATEYGGKISPEKYDPVNHPKHYTNHPSGIECIEVTRHMGFNLGNAMKYIWRADLKNGLEDLKKAIWYINDEISKREKTQEK